MEEYGSIIRSLNSSTGIYIADAHNNVIRKITLCSLTTPAVSITQAQAVLCTSEPANFSATPVNGGGNPVYSWTVNGEPYRDE